MLRKSPDLKIVTERESLEKEVSYIYMIYVVSYIYMIKYHIYI